MNNMVRVIFAVLGLLSVSPSPLRADSVDPGFRPTVCPPGAFGGYPHGSGACEEHRCTDDSVCFGNPCVETALCIDGTDVVSECGVADVCMRGTCVRTPRCRLRSLPPATSTPGASSGCACGVGTRARSAPRWALFWTVVLVARIPRARPRRAPHR